MNPLIDAIEAVGLPTFGELLYLLETVLIKWYDFSDALIPWGGMVFAISLINLLRTDKECETTRRIWGIVVGCSFLVSFGAYLIFYVVIVVFIGQGKVPVSFLAGHAIGASLGCVTYFFSARYIAPGWNKLQHRMKRGSAVERNRRTDARTVHETLPVAQKKFNPSRFFAKDPRKGGVFVGLDEKKEPFFINYAQFASNHIQIVGGTGAGKGLATGVLLAQALRAGEAVFVLDPKNDEWAPSVLSSEAKKAGVPFHLIDLNKDVPQLDFLAGITSRELEEVFLSAFSLAEKGEAADFYRIADRRYSKLTADLISSMKQPTLAALYKRAPDDAATAAAGFHSKLEELARVIALSGLGGVDLRNIVDRGGVVYVIGSMRNQRIITATRALFIRLIQLAEARDRLKETRKIRVFLDEVKYHLSRAALEGLGAARDKGLFVIVAHQSIEDLRDCPADLDADAVVGAVVENCRLRLAYRVQSPDTAKWLAEMTGTILVDDEVRDIETNFALAEKVGLHRHIKQAERNQIDINQFLNLPDGVAVFMGLGMPSFVHVSPVQTEKKRIDIESVQVSKELISTERELPAVEKKKQRKEQTKQPESSTNVVVSQSLNLPPIVGENE